MSAAAAAAAAERCNGVERANRETILLIRIIVAQWYVWLNGLVVSALGIRTRGPGFDSRVAPLFHWVATLGQLFTHIASPISQLEETGIQKGSFRRLSGYGD